MAATGAASENREVVVDEPPAAIGQAGGRLAKHGRYYWLLLAEGHLTRRAVCQHGWGGSTDWRFHRDSSCGATQESDYDIFRNGDVSEKTASG